MYSKNAKIPLSSDFKNYMLEIFSEDEVDRLLFAIDNTESQTSIRFNKEKGAIFFDVLDCEDVEHCHLGKYLHQRPSFIADPLFHAGVYYVQESSSMILYQIKQFLGDKPMLALDMCASPGGKSTLLNDILPCGSVLVSNEVVPNRATVLKENIQKWGGKSNIVTSSYPQKWEDVGEIMDLVLVDAPCSGEGMFRKDIDSRLQWTKESPFSCSQRQKEILSCAYKTLKEGGLLIYSTCTYNRQENEDVLTYIVEELGADSIPLDNTPTYALKSDITKYHAYRFMPHVSKGEGLFFSIVRKKGVEKMENPLPRNKTKNFYLPDANTTIYCNKLLDISDMIVMQERNGCVWAMDKTTNDLYLHLESKGIKILSKGVEVCVVKGRDIVPSSSLVMNSCFSKTQDVFQTVDVSRNDALSYLRGETIGLEESVDRGFVIITYKNIPLGFVKNIGNRVNNLYPNSWRIKKSVSELTDLETLF